MTMTDSGGGGGRNNVIPLVLGAENVADAQAGQVSLGTSPPAARVGIVLPPYRFTEEDHYAAGREGYIKQINSFSQSGHREFGAYDFRDGVYGEIAFAGWAGIERDIATQGVLSDGGVDFTDGGVTIDVKTTASRGTWPEGRAHLLRPRSYPLKANIYVLLVVFVEPLSATFPGRAVKARFAGWATREELSEAPVRMPDGEERPKVYVPTRCLPEGELHEDWRGWL